MKKGVYGLFKLLNISYKKKNGIFIYDTTSISMDYNNILDISISY